jgi:hypothetical protein
VQNYSGQYDRTKPRKEKKGKDFGVRVNREDTNRRFFIETHYLETEGKILANLSSTSELLILCTFVVKVPLLSLS